LKSRLSKPDGCGEVFAGVCNHSKEVLKAVRAEKIFVSEWTEHKAVKQSFGIACCCRNKNGRWQCSVVALREQTWHPLIPSRFPISLVLSPQV